MIFSTDIWQSYLGCIVQKGILKGNAMPNLSAVSPLSPSFWVEHLPTLILLKYANVCVFRILKFNIRKKYKRIKKVSFSASREGD